MRYRYCARHNIPAMAKKTLYIPDDLMVRMAQAEEINWSQVACDAFEAKLRETAVNRGVIPKQNIIQRLRTTKVADDNAYQHGWRVGYDWANNAATWPQLARVCQCSQEDDLPFMLTGEMSDQHSPKSAAQYLAERIQGHIEPGLDHQPSRPYQVFWADILRRPDDPLNSDKTLIFHDINARIDSPHFLQGFIDGACKLRDEVVEQG
jgi:hypothetical protein